MKTGRQNKVSHAGSGREGTASAKALTSRFPGLVISLDPDHKHLKGRNNVLCVFRNNLDYLSLYAFCALVFPIVKKSNCAYT